MKSRFAIAISCAAAAIVAVAVLSSGGSPSNLAGVGAVARAAETTSQAGGAQVLIAGTVTAPGNTLTMRGSGHMNFKASEGEFTFIMGGLPASVQAGLNGSSIEMTEVMKGGALYMNSPLLSGKLPGGATWMKMDLASVEQAIGVNPSSMSSFGANPSQYLSYLKAVGGSVSVVGHQTVRGVATTRYRGKVNVLQAMEKAAGANAAKERAAFSKVAAELNGGTMPVDVWIDGSGKVRKETLTIGVTAAGERVGTSINIEFFGFGRTPSVDAPSGGEVYDLTQQMLQGLSTAQ